jgi:REP element-mobilizing transposase RayT
VDRLDFLSRLEAVCADGAAFVYAWCLMDNHFHLEIRTGSKPRPKLMRRLLTGYAMGFNRQNQRSGHLLQNRYKSTVVDDERYFLALARYIHLNPLRARIVKTVAELEDYPWTGHSVLMGRVKAIWQDVDEVLSRFGRRAGPARRELSAFMGMKEAKKEEAVFKGGGLVRSIGGMANLAEHRKGPRWASDERILGEGRFVESVLREAESETGKLAQFRDPGQRRECFERLIAAVCEALGVTEAELIGGYKRRAVSQARQVLGHVAMRHLGLTAAEIGRAIGVSSQAILKASERGQEVLSEMNLQAEELVEY